MARPTRVAGGVQMRIVDVEIHRAVGEARRFAQRNTEARRDRLDGDADVIDVEVAAHGNVEVEIDGAALPVPGGDGVDAEAGGVAQRLHVGELENLGQ